MNHEQTIRILMVDDHVSLMAGLASLLTIHDVFTVVGQAPHLASAKGMLVKFEPDIVLLDIQFSNGDCGFPFISIAKQLCPRVKVIVFSTHSDLSYRHRAQEIGADGYLGKDEPITFITRMIRDVARTPRGEAPLHFFFKEEMPDNEKAFSPLEKKILTCLLDGMAQKEISAHLDLSASSVATCVQRMKEKKGAKTLAQLMSMAAQISLCLEDC